MPTPSHPFRRDAFKAVSPRDVRKTVFGGLCLLLLFQVLRVRNRSEPRSVHPVSKDVTSICKPNVTYHPPGLIAFRNENEFGPWLDQRGYEIGAEVGVQMGYNARFMLETWKNCKAMHLIDLWAHQENYNDTANHPDDVHLSFMNRTVNNVEPWKDKVHIYKMLSTEAAQLFSDDSFDFVYLDARHDYCGLTEDINAYWPKVRPGGILAGHDYYDNADIKKFVWGADNDWGLCLDGTRNERAVKGAVEDFALREGLTITVLYQDYARWFVQKPTIPECVKKRR